MKEFNLTYCQEITEQSNGEYEVVVYGDAVCERFDNLMYDINENQIDPAKCNVKFYGVWFNGDDKYNDTIKPVVEAVKSITFVNLEKGEFKDVNSVIESYNFDNAKFNFINS